MSCKGIKIAAMICAVLAFVSCKAGDMQHKDDNTVPHTRDVFAMDTYMNITAYGYNAEKALDDAEKRIMQLEAELSATSETSEVWKLDHSDGEAVKLGSDTAELIAKALDMCKRTDGCLDITVYPVLKAWGFTTGEYRIPEKAEIAGLLRNVGYSDIKAEGNSFKLSGNAEIDLGAVAKGYTGDEIMEIMRSDDVKSAIINLGGNVQTLGKKPDGSEWKIAVRDPFSPDTDMCVLEVADRCVITSGNYERFFIGDDGKRYCHIIDPSDGYPADNGYVSVTVVGKDGFTCDALSTAVFVAGEKDSAGIMQDFADYDFLIVTENGKIYYTGGLAECFRNISSMPDEVITFD